MSLRAAPSSPRGARHLRFTGRRADVQECVLTVRRLGAPHGRPGRRWQEAARPKRSRVFLSLEATDFRRGGDQLAKPNFEYQKRQKELEKKKKKEEKMQRKLEKKNAPGDASPPEAPAEPAPAAREIP